MSMIGIYIVKDIEVNVEYRLVYGFVRKYLKSIKRQISYPLNDIISLFCDWLSLTDRCDKNLCDKNMIISNTVNDDNGIYYQ